MTTITSKFQLSGLHCASCKKITEKRVKKLAGVTDATANHETGELMIQGDREIPKAELVTALAGTGYTVN